MSTESELEESRKEIAANINDTVVKLNYLIGAAFRTGLFVEFETNLSRFAEKNITVRVFSISKTKEYIR